MLMGWLVRLFALGVLSIIKLNACEQSNEEEGMILLWNDLRKQMQRIETVREADIKRIQRLEKENEKFRTEIDQLRSMIEDKNMTIPAKRQRRRRRDISEEKSVEFLPHQDEIIDEVELLDKRKIPMRRIDQEKKLEWLMGVVTEFNKKIDSIGECCSNEKQSAVDIAYGSTEMEKLKQSVYFINNTVAGIKTEQQKRMMSEIENINRRLMVIDNDQKKIWVRLEKNWQNTGGEIAMIGNDEFSGEEDYSGWQTVPFLKNTIENSAFVSASDNAKEVERTAKDAFSMVTQMRTKMDAIENDLSKAFALLEKLKDVELSEPRLNTFSHTIDFIQETLLNITQRFMEIELNRDEQSDRVKGELEEIADRLRLLSLQTEKAKHLARVVKDHQIDHFSAIQQFRQDLNALETNVMKLGIKLTTFQTDFLNMTVNNYKNDNWDLQQDVKIADLYNRIDRSDGKFSEIHQTLKDVLSSLRSKADRAEIKTLGAEMLKNAEKLQITVALNDSLNSLTEAVQLLQSQLPTDCSSSVGSSGTGGGLRIIKPRGSPRALRVQCHLDTVSGSPSDAFAWTIIQKRENAGLDFNRTWEQYRGGFGNPMGEYWLGNEYLHYLTNSIHMMLRVDAWDIFGDYYYAEYGTFKVGSASEGFKLDIGHYSGNLTDAMRHHNTMQFSTVDLDVDASSTHCARFYSSGWWFSNCQKANLNGRYPMGVIWFSSSVNNWIQLEKTVMKVRRVK